jgi:hypothetical protein
VKIRSNDSKIKRNAEVVKKDDEGLLKSRVDGWKESTEE